MTKEQVLLLGLLSKALFKKPAPAADEADWNKLLMEARAQAVPILAYEALDKEAVPADVLSLWKQYSGAVLINNIRVTRNHAVLNEWMKEAGIPYVSLKGCASAGFYPDPICRSMGDVDFLVYDKDLERAGKILEEHGLLSRGGRHPAHIEYFNKRDIFELHFGVAGIPEGKAGDVVRGYLEDTIAKAENKTIEYGSVKIPSVFHHGLVLLIHTCTHLTEKGIGIRHLCDWAVFVNSFTDEEFRAMYESKLKAAGLWKFAQALTQVSVRYLGADPKPFAEFENSDPITKALIEDIIAGGNFGMKDSDRVEQVPLITERKRIGSNRGNVITQFIASKSELIKLKWPACEKHPILLPLGWIYFSFSSLIGIITGRRKSIKVKRVLDGASVRREIYKKLELYKIK